MMNAALKNSKEKMYKEWARLRRQGKTAEEIAKKYKGYKGQSYTTNYIYMKTREYNKLLKFRPVSQKRVDRLVEL